MVRSWAARRSWGFDGELALFGHDLELAGQEGFDGQAEGAHRLVPVAGVCLHAEAERTDARGQGSRARARCRRTRRHAISATGPAASAHRRVGPARARGRYADVSPMAVQPRATRDTSRIERDMDTFRMGFDTFAIVSRRPPRCFETNGLFEEEPWFACALSAWETSVARPLPRASSGPGAGFWPRRFRVCDGAGTSAAHVGELADPRSRAEAADRGLTLLRGHGSSCRATLIDLTTFSPWTSATCGRFGAFRGSGVRRHPDGLLSFDHSSPNAGVPDPYAVVLAALPTSSTSASGRAAPARPPTGPPRTAEGPEFRPRCGGACGDQPLRGFAGRVLQAYAGAPELLPERLR